MSVEHERRLLRSPDQLIGKTAVSVVKEIFEWNGDIIEKGWLRRYRYIRATPSPEEEPLFEFTPGESPFLEELIRQNLTPDHEIAFSSSVKLIGGWTGHIPMVDFRLEVNPQNLEKVIERLGRLLLGGEHIVWAILDSGNSYQAYCLNKIIMTEVLDDRWTILRFAEKCHEFLNFHPELRGIPWSEAYRDYRNNAKTKPEIKTDPIIDCWWFVHSAARKVPALNLRLTNNVGDKKKIPEVAAVVEGARLEEYGVFHPAAFNCCLTPQAFEVGVLYIGSDSWSLSEIAWEEEFPPHPEVYL